MDIEYGQDNLKPVIERRGDKTNGYYKLEFKILNIGTTYYIFENEEIEKQFKEKKLLDEGSEVLLLNSKPQDRENEKDPDSHDRENKKDRKWAIKLKLVDANHCGVCSFSTTLSSWDAGTRFISTSLRASSCLTITSNYFGNV